MIHDGVQTHDYAMWQPQWMKAPVRLYLIAFAAEETRATGCAMGVEEFSRRESGSK